MEMYFSMISAHQYQLGSPSPQPTHLTLTHILQQIQLETQWRKNKYHLIILLIKWYLF